MASEAKVLRGYWQGFFRGQAMAHNVSVVCLVFAFFDLKSFVFNPREGF
jgi:hypothetical protein